MILVTGGAGYIGSHTCVKLLEAGHELVVLDNLCNSKEQALRRVQALAGKTLTFIHGDIRDEAALDAAFSHPIEAVIHFAGLKAVGESVAKPLEYYENNVSGTLTLLRAMKRHGVNRLVFSSSATVYGNPASTPITEDFPLSATNPYGRSKLIVEDMLRDFSKAEPEWRIALLRYFNPIGAHESGDIGEDPNGIPNNLMPFITQVACGKQPYLKVFGNDYPTHDGTGVRDYIHVVDLAIGHLKAVEALDKQPGLLTANLGTGKGYSVLDMVKTFERVNEVAVPHEIVARRPGDIAECWADPTAAERLLGWRAEKGLEEMCRDSWRWQSQNPVGFD
ncbi:UDP-galactose-4-epimerase [Chromobacterium violaceum]|uniref:UDP-glucose 4-epimerase GalE n=1 Tax=Chromobacterium violaceum TaxID=536 RepID=UPI000653AE40|nr:UDP-glucose 4-epimerase GalE [Chromobacterium violaceum]KMN50876.1 UDP-galactose-4-epimerase [Chromobacterium violaceum]KMN85233.1 UDP-galactose-4-epimerase [Chromobacterium violaceum]KMN89502.1 UDP-galactose-4-epimerase [Chromobacterium violaceum]KMO03544.1 UDP-galactose-4-epimerase [Chromobacterium violaceum]